MYFKFHGDILGNQNQEFNRKNKIQELLELYKILNLSKMQTS